MLGGYGIMGSGTSVAPGDIPKSTKIPFIYTIKKRANPSYIYPADDAIKKLNLRDAISKFNTRDDYYIVNYNRPPPERYSGREVAVSNIADEPTSNLELYSKAGNDRKCVISWQYKNSDFKYGFSGNKITCPFLI